MFFDIFKKGFAPVSVCRYIIGKILPYRDYLDTCFTLIALMSGVCFVSRAVTRAVNNLVAPHRLTSDAVDARQELDLRIGISYS